jgi:hypothetical protein
MTLALSTTPICNAGVKIIGNTDDFELLFAFKLLLLDVIDFELGILTFIPKRIFVDDDVAVVGTDETV